MRNVQGMDWFTLRARVIDDLSEHWALYLLVLWVVAFAALR